MAAPDQDRHARIDSPEERPAKKRRRPQLAIRDVKIARIEAVPMTEAEYEDAVEALAVLIVRWWKEHPEGMAEKARGDAPASSRSSGEHPPDSDLPGAA